MAVETGGAEHVTGPSLAIARTRAPARVAAEHTSGPGGGLDTGFGSEWAQWGREHFVSGDALVGLLPDALRARYVFWRTGPNVVRGYALPAAIGSQLLVRLHSGGDRHDGGGGGGRGKSATDSGVVADVRRLPCGLSAGELAKGHWMPERKASETGELRIGATLNVVSDAAALRKAFTEPNAPGWDDAIASTAGLKGSVKEMPGTNRWKINFEDGRSWESVCLSCCFYRLSSANTASPTGQPV